MLGLITRAEHCAHCPKIICAWNKKKSFKPDQKHEPDCFLTSMPLLHTEQVSGVAFMPDFYFASLALLMQQWHKGFGLAWHLSQSSDGRYYDLKKLF